VDISMFEDLKVWSLLCFKILGFSHAVMWSHITEEQNLRSDVFFCQCICIWAFTS